MISNKLKVFSFALAALIMQGTCAFAAGSKGGYDKTELENLQPGWSWIDKDKSNYKVNSQTNSFSSIHQNKDDGNDNKESDAPIVYDQIGPTTDNAVQNTWGNYGVYWARMADGSWTLLENGVPVVGWKLVDGKWYYMNSLGVMQTGWINDRGTWYYLYGNGQMASSTYVSGYYLDANGAMVW